MTTQLPTPPPLPFTMKANLDQYRKRLGMFRIGLAIALSLIILVRFGLLSWLIFITLVTAVIFLILFTFAKRSLTVTADSIEFKNAFGRVKRLRYDEISSVKLFLAYIEAGFGFTPRLIIGTKQGGPFFSATTLYWHAEDLDKLQAVLKEKNVQVEVYAENTLSQTIAKQYPQFVSPFEKHPYWIGLGLAFVLIAGITVGVLLFR